MEEVKYSIAELKEVLDEYLAELPAYDDEWYGPVRSMHQIGVNDFIKFLIRKEEEQDAEREQRRKLYEELKKEFEG